MRCLTTCSAILLLAAAALGCGSTIRGVVRDKPTGNPLASVAVSVGDKTATTNAMGAYELQCDVEGKSVLVVNAPGYFLYSASVAKKGDEGSELVRDIELAPRSAMSERQ